MIAVGRPVAVVLPHDDQRIEKAADLLDHRHQSLDVGLRRIALVRRRLDAVDRQRDDEHGAAAKRIAVLPEHRAAVRCDTRRKCCHLVAVDAADVDGVQSNRLRRHLLAPRRPLLLRHAQHYSAEQPLSVSNSWSGGR